jgi:hypothetical protein
MDAAKSKGGRDLVAYFAGHLAHVVNGNDQLADDAEIVEVKPFRLYERIKLALTTNEKYAQTLVGLWSYQSRADRDEAAEFYFETVLDRPIGRRGGVASSTDNLHRLILKEAVGPRPLPDDGRELSTWQALVGGPPRRRRFRPKERLFELSNHILKCLDAANRPYAEVLRLGLCPKDWLIGEDAVPTNTLKAANAFLVALRNVMRGEVGRRSARAELEEAWGRAPVPGSKDVHDFARGPLGAAILSRLAGEGQVVHVSSDVLDYAAADPFGEAPDAELMRPDEAKSYLDGAAKASAITQEERDLLLRIMMGDAIADVLRDRPDLRRRLRSDFDNDMEAFIADLSGRVAAFVNASA